MNSIQTNHHHYNYLFVDDGNYQQTLISQIIINEFWQLVQQLQIDYHQNNRSSSSSLLIERLDQMIKSIVDRFFSINHQSKTKLQLNKFYQNLSLEFNHIFNQINRFDIIDDDDQDYQEDEDQESISTSDDDYDDDDWFDYENDHYLAKLDAQSYLISMIINNYLLLVCQSSINK